MTTTDGMGDDGSDNSDDSGNNDGREDSEHNGHDYSHDPSYRVKSSAVAHPSTYVCDILFDATKLTGVFFNLLVQLDKIRNR